MSKALLDPRTADRLAKIAGMFGSEHAGERAAAAAQAHTLVCRLGLTWHDMFCEPSEQPPSVTTFRPDWRQMAEACGVHVHHFSHREARFIRDMQVARQQPTGRQLDWLTSLYDRLSDDFGQRKETR